MHSFLNSYSAAPEESNEASAPVALSSFESHLIFDHKEYLPQPVIAKNLLVQQEINLPSTTVSKAGRTPLNVWTNEENLLLRELV